MKRVKDVTGDRVSIGPGTLYSLLDNFIKEKIIAETKVESRRKSYVITQIGMDMLEKEYNRLMKLKNDYENMMKEE